MSLFKKFYLWYTENEVKMGLKDLSMYDVADVYAKVFPNDNRPVWTLRNYTARVRRGTVPSFKQEKVQEIADNILDNLAEAERGFGDLAPADFDDPLSNLIDFPTSWAEINEAIVIDGVKRLGVCNDIHLPYHDKFAVQACFAEFKKRQVDGIYLNGDIMDLEDVSRFEKMPDGRYLKDEIEVGRQFVRSLRKLFPDVKIYWKDGNHEKRLESYVSSKAPELVKLFGMDIPTQLGLADHDIVHIPEHKVAKFGKLWLAHGHELGLKSGTVNIARQVRMRVGVNVMFGHWHKNQQDSSRNLADEVHSAWAIGCLAYLKPRYTGVLNQWTQGGATVDLHDDGNFTVNQFQIADGVVI
jgi:predicted phosphodiesterase